jgi:hypothetical protein
MMNGRFTSTSGAKASRKRVTRFATERDMLKQKTRATEQGLKRSKLIVMKTNSVFSNNSHSGGANNVMSYAAIEMMVCRLMTHENSLETLFLWTLVAVLVVFVCMLPSAMGARAMEWRKNQNH